MIIVHVTHEAVEKIGGIGAVIAGLTTSQAYGEQVSRTILLGPLLNTDRPVSERCGEGGEVIYSALDEIQPSPWREKFRPIERTYDVGLIYGKRKISEPCGGGEIEAEVLLVDVFHVNANRLNLFKGELFKKFQVPSDRFQDIWEYEQYVRLAEPGYEALRAIGGCGNGEVSVILAHEHMGNPTALKAILAGEPGVRTVYYAHENASVRPLVEDNPGHDTMFYNVMDRARRQGRFLEEVFPEVTGNYKHPLVKAARFCDCIFAVGDQTQEEMAFVDPRMGQIDIDRVYNGIPALPLEFEDRRASRARMLDYGRNLFGTRPEWTFTHVARPVLSKGIWRDLRVLHELEPLLAARGETAVYFMLGTLGGQRRGPDVRQMERCYGWPVGHERGYPDLCGGEENVEPMFAAFNREHEAVRAVFVNQWGWSRALCGQRMPEEMTFADIRRGTDVEFGLSVYEPFGISQLEPLCFGAVCAVSNVCGCMGFVRQAAEDSDVSRNVIEANFLSVPASLEIDELLGDSRGLRERAEDGECRRVARAIDEALPRDEDAAQQRLRDGYELARRMSWERVVTDYFLPSLDVSARQR